MRYYHVSPLTSTTNDFYDALVILERLTSFRITLHIWIPTNERLAPSEKLFVTPMYCSLLMDQSLSLNRRRDDEGEVKTEDLELDRVGLEADNDISQYYETISIHTESSQTNAAKGKTSDSITRIYACATMWHETKSEMMEMLKSLFRFVLEKFQIDIRSGDSWSNDILLTFECQFFPCLIIFIPKHLFSLVKKN